MELSVELIIGLIVAYFALLFLISFITSKASNNDSFFTGNKESKWYIVAYGMVGAALSGVTFISLPGTVMSNGFHFGQFILGNILGYLFISFVLIPLYYKYSLVSIYSYLEKRFGFWSYKTGSFLFILSQSFGAALRMLLAIKVLDVILGVKLDIPLPILASIFMILIYLYTFKSGIKTIVWTDLLQTTFLLLSVIFVGFVIITNFEGGLSSIIVEAESKSYFEFFNWDSKSPNFFWNRLVSGFLIAIAMMGLDQNMMQKSLTINNVKEAKINTLTFSLGLGAAQIFFLFIGVLLYLYAGQVKLNQNEYQTYKTEIAFLNSDIKKETPIDIKQFGEASLFDSLPRNDKGNISTDKVFPYLAVNKQVFGFFGGILFILGIIAAAFSSADSALTALTTSFCYDFLEIDKKKNQKRVKNIVHFGFALVLLAIIICLRDSSGDIFSLIFTVAAYTYAPLLGLFIMGIFSKVTISDRQTPLAAIIASAGSYLLIKYLKENQDIDLGFLAILVGATLMVLLCLIFGLVDKKEKA